MNEDIQTPTIINEDGTEVQQRAPVKYSLSIAVLEDGAIDFTTTGSTAGLAEFLGLLKILEMTLHKKASEQLFSSTTQDEVLHAKVNLILKAAGIMK
jgi:hypothetical protein